ncbi:MAG: hypothetical protein KatS3mg108_0759 [Isosphaeraceae bacterium]|jgi:uncharacterized protein YqjF (DUF2071 family)|nr:MAG: hypothetical protein KatS3mg108_0759 [Isosphaeraceae bacterium]
MHPSLHHLDHRPWPLPARPWTFRQSWCNLLFLHWPVEPATLARHVPEGLTLQTFDGAAWLAVVPFRMTDVAWRGMPSVPGLSAFPELNVRTYVEKDGIPGVWFLSLDAGHRLAVWAARRFFHLPYVYARMACRSVGETIVYRSERPGPGPRARFAARYEPIGPPSPAVPGTLEHFLTERYCLYARTPSGAYLRGQVHHPAWPLQDARVRIEANELPAIHGFDVDPAGPAHARYAHRVDVVLWPFEPPDGSPVNAA